MVSSSLAPALGAWEDPNRRLLADLCDFGTSPEVALCNWTNLKVTELKWQPSKGESAFWLGGPKEDATYGDSQGEYSQVLVTVWWSDGHLS